MLATIVSYWFVSLPAVLTGLFLLKALKRAHDEKQSKERVPAAIRKN